jgi:hypothetical protein
MAPEPAAKGRLRESTRLVVWGLGLNTAVTGIGALLTQHRAGSLAAQAFAAEWGAGALAVAWSDPEEPPPTTGAIVRRAGTGILCGLAAAGAVLAFAVSTHAAEVASAVFAPPELLMTLVTAGLISMRDELLLRGLALRAFRHVLPPVAQILVCGAIAAAAAYGAGHDSPNGSPPSALMVAALTGGSLAALWLRDRGAWMAWGAHLGWRALTSLDGGAVQLRWSPTAWGGGHDGFTGSLAIAIAMLPVSAIAGFAWYRARNR